MVRLAGALTALILSASLLACGDGAPVPSSNPVEGLVTGLSGTEMTVVLPRGGSFRFVIADPTVTVEHLHEHRVQRLPVRVGWERRDGALRATTIDDA